MFPSVSTDTGFCTQHVRRRHKSVLFNEFIPVDVSTPFRPRTERKSVSETLLRAPNDIKWTRSGNPKYTDARKIETFYLPYRPWQYERMVPSANTDTACWNQQVRRRHKSVLFNEFIPVGVSTPFRPRTERRCVSEKLLRAPNDKVDKIR